MKPLIHLVIIVALPFFFFGAEKTGAIHYKPSKTQYCNARFEFCVTYPAVILPEQKVSDNDDGVILKSSNRQTEVSITGSYNVLQWTPEELFRFTVNNLPGGGSGIKVISSAFRSSDYECHFTLDSKEYYHKALFVKDFYVQEIISTSVQNSDLIQRLMEEIGVNFQI